jgi:hypothetical protein
MAAPDQGAAIGRQQVRYTTTGSKVIRPPEPRDRYTFTIGHLPSDSGRNASSAGVVPISL